jgi:hypothetical protein
LLLSSDSVNRDNDAIFGHGFRQTAIDFDAGRHGSRSKVPHVGLHPVRRLYPSPTMVSSS